MSRAVIIRLALIGLIVMVSGCSLAPPKGFPTADDVDLDRFDNGAEQWLGNRRSVRISNSGEQQRGHGASCR